MFENEAVDIGPELDTKYHNSHDFRAYTPSKEKSSDNFKDLYKLKLQTKDLLS